LKNLSQRNQHSVQEKLIQAEALPGSVMKTCATVHINQIGRLNNNKTDKRIETTVALLASLVS